MLAATAVHEAPWTRQRLRVLREDRTLFLRPALGDVLDLARQNHDVLTTSNIPVQGRPLSLLREWTRRDACVAARQYTAALLGEPIDDSGNERLFVAGHQPTLFHPGVWAKNFAIAEMAARSGGTALNLIVDNDVLAATRIRVPTKNSSHPAVETVSFDEPRIPGPWEEAVVGDRDLFASFGNRIAEKMSNWKVVPLVADIWPDAVRQIETSPLLRDALTAARSRQERRWGAANLELPISRLCELDPFLWFASHVMAHLPRFREIYNQVLREYRRVNRIRSSTHPVPELKSDDGWLEAPFWVWRAGDRKRSRLMVERNGHELRLSDGKEVFATLPLPEDGDACCAVEVLRSLPERGIRLRTRALTTTLFARLFLADLFVHGIGGSKYDEMTDRIISRFFGLPAPAFQTLSATLYLPLATPYDVKDSDESRLTTLLRDLEFNPERHLTNGIDPALDALLAEKSHLIAEQQAVWNAPAASRSARRRRSRENYGRFQKFQEVNSRLAAFAADQRRCVESELSTMRRQLADNAILQDREFSFCLYPEAKLRGFMTHLWDLPAR